MPELIMQWLDGYRPDGFHPFDTIPTLGFVIVIVFFLGVMIRVFADKASKYNHALASAMALLFVYISLIMLHDDNPPEFIRSALEVLPLIDYHDGAVTLFQFRTENFQLFFNELLYAFILSFILIGIDDLIPDAKNAPAWILLQMFIVCISVFLYWGATEALEYFFPGVLDSFAPLILGVILLFMIIMSLLKMVLGLLLATTFPLLGAFTSFFGTSPIGRALGKAALCALFLCVVAGFIGYTGQVTFILVEMTWLVCILPLLVILLLWFVVGYLL